MSVAVLSASRLDADTLAPSIVGGLIDTTPKDGVADRFDDGPFIAKVSGGEYRAIVEFDVSSIPTGVILSANVTGKVGPNNSFNTGLREHLVEFYTADGVLGLDDYSVPGISLGEFSHAAGGSTAFDFDVTGVLHNLRAAGATHVGMRISSLSDTMPFDVLYSNEAFSDAPRLHFEVLPTGSGTQRILPTFDAEVSRENGVFILEEGSTAIYPRSIGFANIDSRGVIEFSLDNLPDNIRITEAKVEFDVRALGGGSGYATNAPIYGYAGDGVAAVADALNLSNPIGILGPATELDPIRVDIDHDYINSLLGDGNYLGLAILGDPDYDSIGFATLEFAAISSTVAPAQLFLTYVSNEPSPGLQGDFNGDGVVNAADYTVWRDHLGSDGEAVLHMNGDGNGAVTFADHTVWKSNYGATQSGTLAVPSPTGATLLMGCLVAVGCRKPDRAGTRKAG